MLKKILIGGLAFVVIASIGLLFWARAVFTHDTVRMALAGQLSKSLGQPVAVDGISASIYPRITVNLTGVEIGQPARIHVETLKVGADLRALLSRRIEHAAIGLTGARIDLPLPEFAITSTPASSESSSSSSVKIVSIDEIVLRDVAIISGGRTLHGDVEVVPHGAGLTVRKITLAADKTKVDITGQIDDLSGPVGELSVKAGGLSIDDLLAFISGFASGAATGATAGSRARGSSVTGVAASPMNLVVSVDADSATVGGLVLQKLSGRARITPDGVALTPVRFRSFDGSYDGALSLKPGTTAGFRMNAALSDLDMAAVATFVGSPDTITGRLSGKIDLSGSGVDAASALKSAKGNARIDITNGIVKRLGLVRSVLLATSGRSGAPAQRGGVSNDEPFARVGATLAIVNGVANTSDLRFESNDLLMTAAGALHLDGSAMALTGQVQLSDKLSQQVGRDLVRYTQQEGRVTLPVTLTGSADNPQVRVDVANLAREAITNRATQEIKKGLGRLFGKK